MTLVKTICLGPEGTEYYTLKETFKEKLTKNLD